MQTLGSWKYVGKEVGQGHVDKSTCGVVQRKLASRSNVINRN